MKIAVDAMGSDNAPLSEIDGVVQVLKEDRDLEVLLVGKEELLLEFKNKLSSFPAEIIHASEVIGMHESPSKAIREKRDSSISKAILLLKERKVDAVVTMGNTGAAMTFTLFTLGNIPGVKRPALATVFPTLKGNILVLDIGANAEVKPEHLLQFGIMGSITASLLFKKASPTVGLLNIGEESSKGNTLTINAYKLLKDSGLNFIGNVEACNILKGVADVIVCDGFVGNVMLKFGEGVVELLNILLKEYLLGPSKYRLRRSVSKPVLQEFLSRLNYEETGGALLLGVDGTVVIGHGRSKPIAVKNAIKTASFCVKTSLSERLKEGFSKTV